MTDKTPAKAATPAPTEKPVAPAAPATPETTTPVAPEVEGAPGTDTPATTDELAPEGADNADALDAGAGDESNDDADDTDEEESDDDLDDDDLDGDDSDDDLDTTQDRYRVIVVHERAVPGYLPQGASHTFELYAKSEADAEKKVTKKGGLLAVSWPDNSSTEADREKKSHKGHDGQWEVASVAKIF